MNYDWILFDADHTLFDFDKSAKESIKLTLAEHEHPYVDGYFERYYVINKQCWREFEDGLIDREILRTKRFRTFFNEFNIQLDPGSFHDQYLAKLPMLPYFMDDALQLLNDLQDHCQLGLITNGLKEVQRPRLLKSDVIHLFKLVVISGEIGHAKPNKAYFDYAYERMDEVDKERVLVVGDNLNSDIKGGRDYGFKTCWYNPKSEINEDGILPDFEITDLKRLYDIIGI
jgi:YjjG family noncanonical pyrimidine nucleotidase